MRIFYQKKISFPFHKMVRKDCCLYHDSIIDYNIKLIKYVEIYNCTDCQIGQLSEFNNETSCSELAKKIPIIYIVKLFNTKEINELYLKLCRKRIKGDVYIDTCNAFISANPQIPDNELFHTFVINKEGKVLMVGNPFANEKMEALFKKVIAKERKKAKNKMTYTKKNLLGQLLVILGNYCLLPAEQAGYK